jgi:hypothetical protein
VPGLPVLMVFSVNRSIPIDFLYRSGVYYLVKLCGR